VAEPTRPRPAVEPPAPDHEADNQRLRQGLENFFERVTPWLFDLGSWIFGSLLAFNLLLLGSLFTIGPVDRAARIGTLAFALALPLNVTGLVLLRLVRELKDIKIEDELAQALLEVGFTGGGRVTPPPFEAMRQRRSRLVLVVSPFVMVVSTVLTVIGMTATLWHMAWWIALAFLLMIAVGIAIVSAVVAGSPPPEGLR